MNIIIHDKKRKIIKRFLRTILIKQLFSIATHIQIVFGLIFKKPLITYRNQLPVLSNFLNLRGKGVEVGVFDGDYSEDILSFSRLATLYSVDPWKRFSQPSYCDSFNMDMSQDDYDNKWQATAEKLKKYKSRSAIMRMTSIDAAKLFPSGSMDFIYIDANHSYDACKEDIEVWWPKLKKGGIFSGHDYLNKEFKSGGCGVKSAVDEFVVNNNQKLFVIPGSFPTWYIIKA